MSGWLLDTNILAELRRPKPAICVVNFIRQTPLAQLFVSTVTFAEIRFGIEISGSLAKRAQLSNWLANEVRPLFTQRVLTIDEDVMLRWRLILEEGRRSGHTYSQPDLIIAATALNHGLVLVTRDVKDFVRAGVKVFNPWDEPVTKLR